MASSSARDTSQAETALIEDMNLNGSLYYTVEGIWKKWCYVGRTSFESSSLADDEVRISIFHFHSIDDAKAFVLPLKFFSKSRYVNNFFFVTENKMDSVFGNFHVIVDGIVMDMTSFIDHNIHQMVLSKPENFNWWWKYGGGYFKRVFRGLNIGMVTILSKTARRFDFPPLMHVGAVSIDGNGFPKFTKLEELTDPNVHLDIKSKTIDLANTMEYFIVTGAVDIPVHLQIDSEDKMTRLGVPRNIIDFIGKCKSWDISKEPIEWLLDSCCLWTKEVTVEWIDSLAKHVVDWRNNITLRNTIDMSLAKKLDGKVWPSYLPSKSRSAKVYNSYMCIMDAEEARLRKGNRHFKRFIFHDLVKFFRHMLVHFNDPFEDEEEKLEPWEICDLLETHFVSIGGLLNMLREVLGSVFCRSPYILQRKWKQLLSSEFAKVVSP